MENIDKLVLLDGWDFKIHFDFDKFGATVK